MSDTPKPAKPANESKPGILKRVMERIDSAIKQKAEEKSQQGCCCRKEGKDNDECC